MNLNELRDVTASEQQAVDGGHGELSNLLGKTFGGFLIGTVIGDAPPEPQPPDGPIMGAVNTIKGLVGAMFG